jgi:hypothetical protein
MATAQASSESVAQVKRNLADRNWRLCNLYFITDRDGNKVRFSPNWAQQRLMEEWSYRNIILKSRQIGFTTFIQLLMLDVVLFNSNIRCGTIAQDRDTAKAIFQDKIRFPYDNLPDVLKSARPVMRDSAFELALANNSTIRVGTSLRGGTLQYLHVSEFGKISARFPEKAREIITGSFNTVRPGQFIFVESTAEGQEGRFFDMTEVARANQRLGKVLGQIDFKFHFFGWHQDPACRLDPTGVVIDDEARKYFGLLERDHGVVLDAEQQAFWAATKVTQQEDMGREYPGSPDEAFASAVDGSYYGKLVAKVEKEGRIGSFKAVEGVPVNTAWDIGRSDASAIWFWQRFHNQIRCVGYFEDEGEAMPYYAGVCREMYQKRGWLRNGDAIDWFPHDGRVTEWGSGRTRVEQLVVAGFNPRIPIAMGLHDGINAVRAVLPIMLFDAEDCVGGIKVLKNYRKAWNEDRAQFSSEPFHNWASHGADAMRTLACAYRNPELPPDPEKLKAQEIIRAREERMKAARSSSELRRGR